MSVERKAWWQRPLRVIQPNLQVRDTGLIDPEQLAEQMKSMGGNTIVFNVGGIYAWYPTKVPYHTVNEHLPASFDLLRAVIEECHKRDIRFIARLDFSKAEDSAYLSRPEWFARQADGEPLVIGAKRPGPWSLLMSTCINSAYRNEAVAIPVLEEVLQGYDVDGIFFNAPGYVTCHCEGCRRKYRTVYGRELPQDAKEFAPEWASTCMRDNMDNLYSIIKKTRPEVPMILYYNLYKDNLFDRAQTTDMLCTEPQDILSLGHRHIPEFWKPALSIKLGRSLPERPAPFGIVHSSPGMDWRHTGLPPAEYRFWLSQIPAHGGSIWHSLTGIPETITDKRILEVVSEFNRNVEKVENYMEDAQTVAQVALMWTADASAEGWADGLIARQILFDVLLLEQATPERLQRYKALVIPEGMSYTDEFLEAITAYVNAGGQILAEGAIPERRELLSLLGISRELYGSEYLTASYLRFEGDSNPLQKGLEQTELIAHCGKVIYTRPADAGTEVLATLVPPFSPMESVGAPPERASLAVSHTDIPLALRAASGKGHALYFPFSLSHLINEFKLDEHYRLLANAIDLALGDEKLLETSHYQGLQVTAFEKGSDILIHLVNGAGRRPLSTELPLYGIQAKLRLNGKSVKSVRQLIAGESPAYSVNEGMLHVEVPELRIWECLLIETEES
ncbi:alpha-amylase family protein [Paenibacillus silviterrae]|uniref:alpha-amylase family protein n=1 Tax=Paenibacillus silviterrae TaxID=3242194 RepID=UPI0025433EFC|nr:alpha-amylase family protein [Paenibacillus chinjuensis]